jgi:hypothetical protein
MNKRKLMVHASFLSLTGGATSIQRLSPFFLHRCILITVSLIAPTFLGWFTLDPQMQPSHFQFVEGSSRAYIVVE